MKQTANNFLLYAFAAVPNLLAFSSGVAHAWSSPVLPKLTNKFDFSKNPLCRPITPSEQSWIVGLLSLGAVFGPIFSGTFADKAGRKMTLIIIACPIAISYFMMAFSNTIFIFYVARLITGIGIGSVYTVLPLYIAEIAEDHNRGTLSCLMGVFISSGFLFSYAVGPYLSVQNFCLICSVPVITFIPLFYRWNPETPQHLAKKQDYKKMQASLKKLRNKTDEDIIKEMSTIQTMIEEDRQKKSGIRELFSSKTSRKWLVITLSLIVLQQFAGINAVYSYMQSIFDATGSTLPSETSTVIIGVIQIFATICTSTLADLLGRRILLLISATGSCFALLILGLYFFLLDNQFNVQSIFWIPVVSLIVFVVFFNFGLAVVPWTIMAELFPSNVKSVASALTAVVCFISTFVITFYFPSLTLILGMAKSFWMFSGICAIGSIFIYCKVTETKGISLDEIQNLLEIE